MCSGRATKASRQRAPRRAAGSRFSPFRDPLPKISCRGSRTTDEATRDPRIREQRQARVSSADAASGPSRSAPRRAGRHSCRGPGRSKSPGSARRRRRHALSLVLSRTSCRNIPRLRRHGLLSRAQKSGHAPSWRLGSPLVSGTATRVSLRLLRRAGCLALQRRGTLGLRLRLNRQAAGGHAHSLVGLPPARQRGRSTRCGERRAALGQ